MTTRLTDEFGYTFTAVTPKTRATAHLRYPWPPPHPAANRTMCGRVVGEGWKEITAKSWYTHPERQCQVCGPRIGPYATIKL